MCIGLQHGPSEHLRRQIYSLSVTEYEGVCFGLITVLEWPKDRSSARRADALSTYLSTSGDCVHFDLGWIYKNAPLVAGSELPGSFDAHCTMAAAQFVTHRGEHSIYYVGNPVRHEHINKPGVPKGAVGVARFRLDGLAYLSSIDDLSGEVVTKAFRLEGSRLTVNYDLHHHTSSQARVRVSLLRAGSGEEIMRSQDMTTGNLAETVPTSTGAHALVMIYA